MHDPDILLYEVPVIRLDIWHREPSGHDSGTVCGHAPHGWHQVLWTLRHVRHLRYRWWPAFRIRKWLLDRCDHCGRRFRWREGRYSFQSTDKVWHDPCMALRHVRSQLDDLTGLVLATADDNARWRANRRLEHLEKQAAEAADAGR